MKMKEVWIINSKSIIKYCHENMANKHESPLKVPFKTTKVFTNGMETSQMGVTEYIINIFFLKPHTTKDFMTISFLFYF